MRASQTPAPLGRGSAWHAWAGGIVSFWLLVGISVNIAALLGAELTWWQRIHVLTLGALSTAILVYSTHFTEALTRRPTPNHRAVATRVGLLNASVLVLLFVPLWSVAFYLATVCILAVFIWHSVAIFLAWKGALSGAFAVTVPFYVGAAAFMVVAIGLALAAGAQWGNYDALIAAHSRATLWGLAWLTVLGTVVTFLPTLAGAPISPRARQRAPRTLLVHCLGLLLALIGLVEQWHVLAAIGQVLCVCAAVYLLQPVLSSVLGASPRLTTPSLSVCAGVLWVLAVQAADGIAITLGVAPRELTTVLLPALVGGGVLQLVAGALQHLVPTLARRRQPANKPGWIRVGVLNLGAFLTLVGPTKLGIAFLAAGLAAHMVALASMVLRPVSTEKNS